jgi:hypothetical protein
VEVQDTLKIRQKSDKHAHMPKHEHAQKHEQQTRKLIKEYRKKRPAVVTGRAMPDTSSIQARATGRIATRCARTRSARTKQKS